MPDHLHVPAGEATFVAKLLSTAGPSGGAPTDPAPYSLDELVRAADVRLRLTPGVDGARRCWTTRLAFQLAPIHPHAVAPGDDDEPLRLARFGAQLLGDLAQAANPVRRLFLAKDVDLLDGPPLDAFDDDVRTIVLATATPIERTDRVLARPHAASPRDFWGADWHAEVAAAVDGWRAARPPRESWIVLLVDPRFATHAVVARGPFATRARLVHAA